MRLVCLCLALFACVATPPPRPASVCPTDRLESPAREQFVSTVEPILHARCLPCHGRGGCCSGFLIPTPDVYTALKLWPGLIGTTPQESSLYTKGIHGGPAFRPAEKSAVAAWIHAERKLSASR